MNILNNFPYIYTGGVFLFLLSQIIKNKKYIIYLLFFVVGFYANKESNRLLKLTFKEERPKENKIHEGAEKYGFPSGHAQILFYPISFLICLLFNEKNKHIKKVLGVTLFFIFGVYYHRWSTGAHTIRQLLAGSLFGTAIGSLNFYLCKFLFLNYLVFLKGMS